MRNWSIFPYIFSSLNATDWGGGMAVRPEGGGGSMSPPPLTTYIRHFSQLIIGYHWLAYLNQVCKQSKTQSSKFPIH